MLVELFDQLGMLDSEVVMGQLANLAGEEQMVLAHGVVICISQIASASQRFVGFIVLL